MTGHKSKENSNNKISRRNILKGLAALPVFGTFTYNHWKKKAFEEAKNKVVQLNLGLTNAPSILPTNSVNSNEKLVRIGIIGVGSRGTALLKATGFIMSNKYNQL